MKRILFCLIFLFVFNGCGITKILKLKKELTKADKTAFIVGRVTSDISDHYPIFVGIFEDTHQGKTMLDMKVFAGPSLFSFLVPHGEYDLSSFQDLNGSSRYDKGEPAALRRIIKTDGEKERFNLHLDTQFRLSEDLLYEFRNARQEIKNAYPISFGNVADLNDYIFSADFGSKGLWEPLYFIKKAGFGIYFIEEYSPDKVPVLYVGGAAGAPLGWKYFMDNIDKEKFQAWFFLYPSGIRIGSSAKALADIMQEVHQIYGFDKIILIAHSMGGLVTRRSIQLLHSREAYDDYVNLFVSISTPWNGHPMAARGVKRSPAVVPCWIDMDPASDFIQGLFNNNIPCDHHLLFSYEGKTMKLKGNSDGTVSLYSQLRSVAQMKAKQVFGFAETHGSILESKDVLKHLNRIMAQYY